MDRRLSNPIPILIPSTVNSNLVLTISAVNQSVSHTSITYVPTDSDEVEAASTVMLILLVRFRTVNAASGWTNSVKLPVKP